MATIDTRRKHDLTMEEARKRAEELARSMEEKLGIRWRWDGDSIRFDTPAGAARGTTGEVSVSSSEIRVQINLPLLLRPLRGVVEGKVREKFDSVIGPG